MNGYFVHFFSPSHIGHLRKHVIYVLDLSGSMYGRKLVQLKEVMNQILDELEPDDYFSIITFNGRSTRVTSEPQLATEFALRNAHNSVVGFTVSGMTNTDAALRDAFDIASKFKEGQKVGKFKAKYPKDIDGLIVMITDGEPTEGETNLDRIMVNAKDRNLGGVPIYTVSLGAEADFNFLQKLSTQTNGFCRKIYESGHAHLQIKGFYNHISSRSFNNLKFSYTASNNGTIEKLTKRQFPHVFMGEEQIVAGYLKPGIGPNKAEPVLSVDIEGNGREGNGKLSDQNLVRKLHSISSSPGREKNEDIFLERLWAYLTISQALELDNVNGNADGEDTVEFFEYDDFGVEENSTVKPLRLNTSSKESRRDRALRLALKYGFVTPITSLVVVKPADQPSQNTNETVQIFNINDQGVVTGNQSGQAKKVFRPNNVPVPVPPANPAQSQPGFSVIRRKSFRTTTEKPKTGLDLIKWAIWRNSEEKYIMVHGKRYVIEENTAKNPGSQVECVGGTRQNRFKGRCVHLLNCIRPNMSQDFTQYVTTAFCPISLDGVDYAGVCCGGQTTTQRKMEVIQL